MKNTAQSPTTPAEVAADRFALRVTARLSSGTDDLPYDISERLRASRMQALAKRKPEPFDPERDYLCAAGRLITDSRGMAALLGLLASHGEMGVLSAPSLDLMRAPQDGLGGVGQIGRGLNTAALPGVFPGFSPVGHQGVAYGMCAELFADPTTGAGVGVMTSGTRLNRDTPPLMRVGFDLLTLGFASLRGAD